MAKLNRLHLRSGCGHRAGFSLLEVTIALTILTVGILTVSTAQLHAMRGGQSGRHATQAQSIAQTRIEQLKRTRWTAVAPTPWTAGIVVNNMVDGPGGFVEQSYTVQWRITDVVPDKTRLIDVRVVWNEPNRPNRSYALTTTRYNHEEL